MHKPQDNFSFLHTRLQNHCGCVLLNKKHRNIWLMSLNRCLRLDLLLKSSHTQLQLRLLCIFMLPGHCCAFSCLTAPNHCILPPELVFYSHWNTLVLWLEQEDAAGWQQRPLHYTHLREQNKQNCPLSISTKWNLSRKIKRAGSWQDIRHLVTKAKDS